MCVHLSIFFFFFLMYDIKSSDLIPLFSSVLFSWQGDPWVRTFSYYLFIYSLFMCLLCFTIIQQLLFYFEVKVTKTCYTQCDISSYLYFLYDNTNTSTITTLSSLPPSVLSAAMETCSKRSWSSSSSLTNVDAILLAEEATLKLDFGKHKMLPVLQYK